MQLGILVDWDLIIKAYNNLHCPDDVYNPVKVIKELAENNCKWYVGMSKRKTGKTTNFLLIGMLLWWNYGIHTVYIRQRDDMIAPKNSIKIFDTILQFDYIELITGGMYNSVKYYSKNWYFCKRNETGDIIDESLNPFCTMVSIQSSEDLKSTYNDPFADWIIYDEFIGSMYYPNEFVDFFNFISTVKRLRRSTIINLLANTIDMYHEYFNELCIADQVQKMRKGERALITTELGTKVLVERIEQPEKAKAQDEIDKLLYYGFPNPKLSAITGDEWAAAQFQHIPNGNYETVSNRLYIKYSNKYARLEIVSHETLGLCIYAHWATRVYDDSIILTAYDRTEPNYIFRLGNGKLEMFIRKMFNVNRVYYCTNDVGMFITSYIKYIKKLNYV